MHPNTREPSRLRQAPRCLARTRRGTPCQSPAAAGKTRCRMHGGATGSGAPKGKRNGNYRHGGFTAEGLSLRALMSSIMRWRSGLTASVPMGTLRSTPMLTSVPPMVSVFFKFGFVLFTTASTTETLTTNGANMGILRHTRASRVYRFGARDARHGEERDMRFELYGIS
jgi:hypothetical protein